jgi:hypothetical protein
MDVYGHVNNLDIFLHVSSNMLPPTTVTIVPSRLSHVIFMEQEQQGRTIDKNNTLYNNIKNNSMNNNHSSSFRAITCDLLETRVKCKKYNNKE